MLQWESKFLGHLVGGCIESFYDLVRGERYPKEKGMFDYINGILVGKPQDEVYYEEYKKIYQ